MKVQVDPVLCLVTTDDGAIDHGVCRCGKTTTRIVLYGGDTPIPLCSTECQAEFWRVVIEKSGGENLVDRHVLVHGKGNGIGILTDPRESK